MPDSLFRNEPLVLPAGQNRLSAGFAPILFLPRAGAMLYGAKDVPGQPLRGKVAVNQVAYAG